MRELPDTGTRRRGVFTTAEAVAAGWTVDGLKAATRSGRLHRICRGRYAPAPDPDLDRFARADLLLTRQAVAAAAAEQEAFVSHLAAALLWDWPIWAACPRPCVTVRDRSIARLAAAHVHRAPPTPGEFGRSGDVRLTAPNRTLLDVVREFGVESALVGADAALRRGDVDLPGLTAAVAAIHGSPGAVSARAMLGLVDPAAESPLESRSRWHVHRVTPPQTQIDLFTTGGEFLGRCDFLWPEGVVGEVDGSVKYRTGDDLPKEKWRQERIEDTGLVVVRWGSRRLDDFAATAARIERARAVARARSGPRGWYALPPTW